jgi:hypothetical protein
MQAISKYLLLRVIFSGATITLILAAIAMEMLPEGEAKIFVIHTLITAFFVVVTTFLF